MRAFIEAVSVENEYTVKTQRKVISDPKRSSVQIKCQVAVQPFEENMTTIFEPDLNPQRPDGLEFCSTLVKIRKGLIQLTITFPQWTTS